MPAEGFEPPTFGLQNRCTTTVLSRQKDVCIQSETPVTNPPAQGNHGNLIATGRPLTGADANSISHAPGWLPRSVWGLSCREAPSRLMSKPLPYYRAELPVLRERLLEAIAE